MAKKRKIGGQTDNGGISPEMVADLRGLCSSFSKILDNTGVESPQMQDELGRLLDLYISLCYLTSELELKTDRHIGKLIAFHKSNG